MVKPAVALVKPPRRTSSPSRPPAWRELGLLLLGFILTVACFMGLTLYADTRLAIVAERSHEVSDNAMPSMLELAAVRRALAQVQFDLREGAQGDRERMRALPSHVGDYEAAWSRYEELPLFPGERELQAYARDRIDAAEREFHGVRARIETGALVEAETQAKTEAEPAVRQAIDALTELIQFNHDQGRQVAFEADRTWARARRLSIVADAVCAVVTGALAWFGFRSTRRFIWMQKLRADELEAFASRVAHDVRGPLTPALFTLQMFARDFAGDEKRRTLIDRGLRSLKRVDQLVGDLLDLRALGRDPRRRRPRFSALGDCRRRAGPRDAGDHGGRAGRRRGPPGLRGRVRAGVLASVALNLVSNAIKYMPPGAPERVVRVGAALESGPARHVRVEVADTGAGLPEAMHERIFEPYVRVDRHQPGLGLGLATVRRLVNAHRGQVGVRFARALARSSGSCCRSMCPPPAICRGRAPGLEVGCGHLGGDACCIKGRRVGFAGRVFCHDGRGVDGIGGRRVAGGCLRGAASAGTRSRWVPRPAEDGGRALVRAGGAESCSVGVEARAAPVDGSARPARRELVAGVVVRDA